MLSGSYPIKELADVQRRRKWTAEQLDKVRQASADGYNLDVEDATRNGTKDTELLTTFVGEFYHQFKSVNKNYQASIAIPHPVEALVDRRFCNSNPGIHRACMCVCVSFLVPLIHIHRTLTFSSLSAETALAHGIGKMLFKIIAMHSLKSSACFPQEKYTKLSE